MVICFIQVEKTRHYLLLREKLESTLLLGQEELLSCVSVEQSESPQPSEGHAQDLSLSPTADAPNERQRELVAKVSVSSLKENMFEFSCNLVLLKYSRCCLRAGGRCFDLHCLYL
jgi:hypothetical protein